MTLRPFPSGLGRTVFAAMGFGLIVTAVTTAALANDCTVTYSDFEDNIPHVDLMTCPNNKPDEDTGFCRLAFNGKSATIFVFHYGEDDSCLADVKVMPVRNFLTK